MAITETSLSFYVSRSKKNEILIAPDRDYILIVVQTAAEEGNVNEPAKDQT